MKTTPEKPNKEAAIEKKCASVETDRSITKMPPSPPAEKKCETTETDSRITKLPEITHEMITAHTETDTCITEEKTTETDNTITRILLLEKVEVVSLTETWGTQTDIMELQSMSPILPKNVKADLADITCTPKDNTSECDSVISSMSKSEDTTKQPTAGLDMRRVENYESNFSPVILPNVAQKPLDIPIKERTPSPVDLCTTKSSMKKKLPKIQTKLPAACAVSEDPMDVICHVKVPKVQDGHLTPAHNTGRVQSSMAKDTGIISPVSSGSLDDTSPAADLWLGHARSALMIGNPLVRHLSGSSQMKHKFKMSSSNLNYSATKKFKAANLFL